MGGGDSAQASAYRGTTRTNYSSAVGFAKEVEAVLRRQEAQGQVLALPEAEARRIYGDRLAIASLSALEKGVSDEGLVDVRVLHDGTNGVDLNRYILVLDALTSPMAQDIKASMRLQAGSGVVHFGLTVDVKDAHRVVVNRPEDWPLQACQVYPGGVVFLNKRGAFLPPTGGAAWRRQCNGRVCVFWGPSSRCGHYFLPTTLISQRRGGCMPILFWLTSGGWSSWVSP